MDMEFKMLAQKGNIQRGTADLAVFIYFCVTSGLNLNRHLPILVQCGDLMKYLCYFQFNLLQHLCTYVLNMYLF